MMAKAPNRREFLCSTGSVAAGLATSGSVVFAPDYSWALSPTAIDAHTAQTLLVMARQLFPHDRLGDQYYAAVVDAVDKQAASDAALRKLVAEGVARLDGARGNHQQSLWQSAGLPLLRLRRIVRRARRLHQPRLR